MPALQYSQAMTASQQGLNIVQGWQYEYLPWPARVQILINATTVAVRMTVYSGSQTIVQRGPVAGGGTAGVLPTVFNVPTVDFIAAAGDRLIVTLDETAAGTPTVNAQVIVEPL